MKLRAKDDERVVMGADGLPVAFQIFAPGPNPTIKGTFTFDSKSALSTMARFVDMGNPVAIDYEHQTAADPPIEAPAAGRFGLELRNGSLWAVDVKWTPRAAEQLKGKEYFSFSPWLEHDDEGRIIALNNVALTNFPGTKRQPLLVAAKATGTQLKGSAKMNEDQKAALAALAAGMANEACPADEMMTLLKAALATYGEEKPAEPEGEEKAEQLTAIVALTGKANAAEAMGVIRAWKQGAAETTTLSARIEKLEGDHKAAEFATVIEEGKAAGKLTPALLSSKHEVGAYIETCKPTAGNAGNVAALRAFVSALPAQVKTEEIPQKKSGGNITLSAVEIDMAKRQGIDLKELADFKAKRETEKEGV